VIHRVVLLEAEIIEALTRFAIEKHGTHSAQPKGAEIDRRNGGWIATVSFEPVPTVIGRVKEAT
jgi:hypothetical protein